MCFLSIGQNRLDWVKQLGFWMWYYAGESIVTIIVINLKWDLEIIVCFTLDFLLLGIVRFDFMVQKMDEGFNSGVLKENEMLGEPSTLIHKILPLQVSSTIIFHSVMYIN